jgi:hypothetical protein
MNSLLRAGLAALAATPLLFAGAAAAETVALDVAFRLTDPDDRPLAGVAVRLVLGVVDWQAPDAGVRIVTGDDGTARFTTPAIIDRRWHWTNAGFTPFSIPSRVDHLAIAAELERVLPRRDGGEATYHWLYTADVVRFRDGDCSTDDIDAIYQAAPDGRFTKLLGTGATGPDFQMMVDGLVLTGGGYKLSDFMLSRPEDGTGGHWHLKLDLMRLPKPVLR